MSAMIKVDRGVKMPARDRGDGSGRRHEYPWRAMRVGDSFLFPKDVGEQAARSMSYNTGVRIGRRYAVRKMGQQVRCWRVE
jgi:hypothetical protein